MAPASRNQSGLLSLPPEITFEIYKLVFNKEILTIVDESKEDSKYSKQKLPRRTTPAKCKAKCTPERDLGLLGVCRKLRIEALPFFERKLTTLNIVAELKGKEVSNLIPTSYFKNVKTLEVVVSRKLNRFPWWRFTVLETFSLFHVEQCEFGLIAFTPKELVSSNRCDKLLLQVVVRDIDIYRLKWFVDLFKNGSQDIKGTYVKVVRDMMCGCHGPLLPICHTSRDHCLKFEVDMRTALVINKDDQICDLILDRFEDFWSLIEANPNFSRREKGLA